ncbi:MAG TPA: antibiotic biosynthesis monooxygenase family protein [Solirubrobacteraceae bacterium]|jgi:heme-degrading monooxygenase HmoA|nr:antibiotic biosynthesis monooxygenase family protein [Solirubrobacteraceae bacterium]
MTARIMVFASIDPDNAEAFEAAYLEVTSKVKGTDGHIADELLRAADDPSKYILLSEWESTDAFLGWEEEPIHKQTTTPMRPYWEGKVDRRLFEVAQTIKSRA